MRVVIAMAIAKGWSSHQMDVKNAFFHGNLKEEIYMMQLKVYIKMMYISILFVGCAKPCMA